MNTTFTSNNNVRNGKVNSHVDNRDYSERSGCGGYVLLFVLIVIAVAIFAYILPML